MLAQSSMRSSEYCIAVTSNSDFFLTGILAFSSISVCITFLIFLLDCGFYSFQEETSEQKINELSTVMKDAARSKA